MWRLAAVTFYSEEAEALQQLMRVHILISKGKYCLPLLYIRVFSVITVLPAMEKKTNIFHLPHKILQRYKQAYRFLGGPGILVLGAAMSRRARSEMAQGISYSCLSLVGFC